MHVVLLGNTEAHHEGRDGAAPYCLANWAGDRVLVVPDTRGLGTLVDNVTVTFSSTTATAEGGGPPLRVAAFARAAAELGCNVAPHAPTQALVAGYLEEMDEVLGTVVGHLNASAGPPGTQARPHRATAAARTARCWSRPS